MHRGQDRGSVGSAGSEWGAQACCVSLSAGVRVGASGKSASLSIASLSFCVAHHRECVRGSEVIRDGQSRGLIGAREGNAVSEKYQGRTVADDFTAYECEESRITCIIPSVAL